MGKANNTRYSKVVGVNRKRLLERTAIVWMLLLCVVFVFDLGHSGFVRPLVLDICIAVTAGVIIVLHRDVPAKILAVVLLLCIALPILSLSYLYGGINSPFLILMIFIPVAAFMLVSRPAGWVFTGVGCMYFVVLGVLPGLGHPLPPLTMSPAEEVLARMGSYILVLCCISAIGWYYSRLYDRFYFSLKDSNRELKRIAEYKSQFLASISHEFRTPLNAIIGFSRRLARSMGEHLSSKDKMALDAILRNGEMMQVLVEDVLEMAQIENGKIQVKREAVDLPLLVRNAVNDFLPRASAKKLSLTCAVEETAATRACITDAEIVKKILRQLLSNAVKFTDEGSVEVSLSDSTDVLDAVHIKVTDTGPGIAETELDVLFDRFSRGKNRMSGDKPGTGLGLAIASELVTILTGRIKVESRLGEGSCFTLCLSLACDGGEGGER